MARDLRVVVRERLVNGDTDEQVLDYVVSRYGEFVLLKPRLSVKTLALWGAPAALVLVGLIVAFVAARRRACSHRPSFRRKRKRGLANCSTGNDQGSSKSVSSSSGSSGGFSRPWRIVRITILEVSIS